jgi:uncharacterized protein YbjT (DUF2867 family)
MIRAWLAGASGLVGGVLLRELLADGDVAAVTSVGRRVLPLADPRLSQVVIDFASPGALEALPAPDVAFCSLGTTIRKAGSQEAFRAVDFSAVLAFARAARGRGARTFVHVSSMGADSRSRVFYSRVKGEVEEAVAGVGFESLYALRPSIIDGPRLERRPFEAVGLVLMRTVAPILGKYRPTPVARVASAMIAAAREARLGVHVLENALILRAAARGA